MTREQILAFRYTRHHLQTPLPRKDLIEAARAGIQTGIPGTALLALAARVKDLKPNDLEDALQEKKSLIETYSLRGGATYIVPSEDFPIFTTGVYPDPQKKDEKQLEYFMNLGAAGFKSKKVNPSEGIAIVNEAMLEILKKKALTQDEIHAEWRKKLSKKYLWECRGCKSFHVHPSVVGALCANGEVCFGPMVGGDSAYTLVKNWLPKVPKMKRVDAANELVRRYLEYFGPADVSMFASWAGVSKTQAAETWGLIEKEITEVPHGKKTLYLLRKDLKELQNTQTPKGVHLLPARDPFLDQRDRETLIPEKKLHSKVWKVLANPGVILVDGEIKGVWRAQKKGKVLQCALEPFEKLSHSIHNEIDLICERMSILRECASYQLKTKD